MRTSLHRSAALGVVLSGIAAFSCAAVAQTKGDKPSPGTTVTTTTTTYDGWTVVCSAAGKEKAKSCTANFRVVNQQNGANILVWMFGFNAKGEPMTEVFTFPDVVIKPGVRISLGEGEPMTAGFVSCSSGGCKASMALDGDAVALLKSAKTARMDITRTDGKVVQFKMEVPGIDLALQNLGL